MFLSISRNLQENTRVRVSSLLEVRLWRSCFPVPMDFAIFLWLPLFMEPLGATVYQANNTGVTNKQRKITANVVDMTKPLFFSFV